VREVLGAYRRSIEATAELLPQGEGTIQVVKVEVAGPDAGSPRSGEPMEVRLHFESPDDHAGAICLGVTEGTAAAMFMLRRIGTSFVKGRTEARCTVRRLPLPRGRFYLWVAINDDSQTLLAWHPVASFEVLGPDFGRSPRGIVCLAPIYVEADWAVGRA